jgi:starch phosphorylase
LVNPKIPARIDRLEELANNLWWSWHTEARNVFRTLDYQLWKVSGHNPVKQLHQISADTFQSASVDPAFLALYDSAMATFDREVSTQDARFLEKYPDLGLGPVAYFSMEYAIHNSLPIYAGGLGVLAGDLCKEASDFGLPLVAVGFMFPQGYFYQHLCSDDGICQREVYEQLNFAEAPISRVLSPEGGNAIARVELGDVTIAIGVWQVNVGCTRIYLLDVSLEENPIQYRQLSARLYVADQELRLQQEIILGIGGVRALRALGINPVVWHANEGHTAFMMLERIREEVTRGKSFTEALEIVKATTAFTTHTPVMAGHDVFPEHLMDKYFSQYWRELGIERETFLRLGQHDGSQRPGFNMTAFSLRLANQRNAVSQLHGEVTRRMWHGLWPEAAEDNVPISSITNGVHVSTWIASELYHLFERYLGTDWMKEHDDRQLWERLRDIPDDELWTVSQQLKNKLLSTVRALARIRWLKNDILPTEMSTMGTLLDPEVLTIAFARRFAEYKRPALIFRDIERLKRIITNPWRPVQIIFAGKSHPADFPSKKLLGQVYEMAADNEFEGRIAFVENYDMHMARYLVQGVDVWLNIPRRMQEACGTSGMKASINGTLHLSVRDGWWYEGYKDGNGWALNGDLTFPTPEEEDKADAASFYRLLEEEIVPLYYARDRKGVPHGWASLMKGAIRDILPFFCARRMLREYTELMYLPAVRSLRK